MSKILGMHTSGAPIGSIQASTDSAAPNGWILTNNVTVGLSGTTYAGSAYYKLYVVLWNQPGLSTSAGESYVISSAKGATALADWNAGKTITIDLRGHFLRNSGGSGGSVGAKQLDQMQGHKHTDSGHAHQEQANVSTGQNGIASGAVLGLGNGGTQASGLTNYYTASGASNIGDPVANVNGTPRVGNETRPTNTSAMFIMAYA